MDSIKGIIMKTIHLYIPAIILLSTYAIIDNGESIYGVAAAGLALALAYIYYVGVLHDESQKLLSKADDGAWCNFKDGSKWEFKG